MKNKVSIKSSGNRVLTINGGSSSIKFALYQNDSSFNRVLHGKIDRIGLSDSKLSYIEENENRIEILNMEARNHKSTADFLMDWLDYKVDFSTINGVGHRIVFGMQHTKPEIITQELLDELYRFSSFDPDHMPVEIDLFETFRKRYPNLPQVACFDTTFHSGMPRVAKLIPVPRRFDEKGIQRYGFHGLSYTYLMEELSRVAGTKSANGRVILAHLGNGASMAAVRGGKSIDTSMGFTPAAGMAMGSRPGDLDPGVAWYIMKSEHLSTEQFNHLINHESGLLGISEISSDMRDLLKVESDDIRAAEAVELFCYQAKKWIGAFAAALGGLDTLVFAGGMGENSPVIRSRICKGLEFLGIEIDENRNTRNDPLIAAEKATVAVRIIHTDEEQMIAKIVMQTLNHTAKKN